MSSTANPTGRMRLLAIGLATLAMSALFVGMIHDFLLALLLAAIFSTMVNPLYRKIFQAVGERSQLAVTLTLLTLTLGVLLPTLGLLYVAGTQASDLTAQILSLVEQLDTREDGFTLPDWMPFRDALANAVPQITAKAGELTSKLAGFFASSLSAATRGTASFFLSLFVMLYAMAYFMQQQTSVLAQLMRYSGLPPTSQSQLIERTVAISRATIKGTLLIGLAQGALGGLGLWVAGLPGAAFWGSIMMVASAIPGIGPALVWVPAVIYLLAIGDTTAAIALGLWCGLVVSTIDNVMRPALVGKDTEMPDLLVLVSTLGGLSMFGAVGLIIGPVIAGLFTTLWDLLEGTLQEQRATAQPPHPDDGPRAPPTSL